MFMHIGKIIIVLQLIFVGGPDYSPKLNVIQTMIYMVLKNIQVLGRNLVKHIPCYISQL